MDRKIVNRVKALRISRNYTQKMVADHLFFAQKTYSDYEMGKTNMSIDSLIRLAKFYNVDLDYICGLTDIPGTFKEKQ